MTGTEREDRLALALERLAEIEQLDPQGRYGRLAREATAALRLPPVMADGTREALELAKNIIFGSQFMAQRERNYAKHSEYQSYIDTIDAALSEHHPQARKPQSPVGHYTGRPIT